MAPYESISEIFDDMFVKSKDEDSLFTIWESVAEEFFLPSLKASKTVEQRNESAENRSFVALVCNPK